MLVLVEIGTLFRASSIASKILGHYIRLAGKNYIREMLSPLVRELAIENRDLEVGQRLTHSLRE